MKKGSIVMAILLLMAGLSACGSLGNSGGENPQESLQAADSFHLTGQEAVSGEEEQIDRSGFNWYTDEWKHGGGSSVGSPLYVTEYISGLEYEPEYAYDYRLTEYRTWGHNFYVLETVGIEREEEQELHYYLSCFEGMTGEIHHREIILPQPEGYAGDKELVVTYDILDEDCYVFFYCIWQEEVLQAYLAIRQNAEGDTLSVTDLYPAMCAAGMEIPNLHGYNRIYADARGYYCLLPVGQDSEFAVIDMEGELLCHLEEESAGDAVYSFGMKSPTGESIFIRVEREGDLLRQLMLFDEESESLRVLTQESETEMDIYAAKGLTEDGFLYYVDSYGRLCRWDLYRGIRKICANYRSLGVGNNEQVVQMITGEDGLPILLDYSQGEAIILRLGLEEIIPEEGIRLVSLVSNSAGMTSYISACIADYSKRNLRHPMTMEQNTEAESYMDFRNRKLAELVSGEGADLYYVSRDDMRMLYEQGVAADLTGIIPVNLRSRIFEGVLDCGTIDGQLVGIAPEAGVSTLLVSAKLWPEDTWTWEEALGVLESHPETVQFLASTDDTATGSDYALELLLQDLSHSPFIDPETGRCAFDQPLFIRLLETARDCDSTWEEEEVRDRMLQEGKIAGGVLDSGGLAAFSYEMSLLGEDFHPVGFPTQGESGSYWNAEYFIVVNRETAYMEEIGEYIEQLFREKRQMSSAQSVLKNLITSRLIWADWGDEPHWEYNMGDGYYWVLQTKPDGTPWVDEYLELLNQSVPIEAGYDEIRKIIQEEAADYFGGQKDASAVADIIQNRVQIYLNERR